MQSVDAAGRSLLFAALLAVSLEVGAIRRQVICGSVEVLLVAHELRSAPYDVILYLCSCRQRGGSEVRVLLRT